VRLRSNRFDLAWDARRICGGRSAVMDGNSPGLCYNHTMVTINIDDIQRDLVGYLHRIQAGETLLVLEANQPLAEIKPFGDFGNHFVVGIGEPRPFGLCAGEFSVPDDFDAPLPEDILQDFERA
jgi:antitoxin (DNA-binding transcriptional repressor) of toxin-antitoxin stability system